MRALSPALTLSAENALMRREISKRTFARTQA
jgi:hypothetical protein